MAGAPLVLLCVDALLLEDEASVYLSSSSSCSSSVWQEQMRSAFEEKEASYQAEMRKAAAQVFPRLHTPRHVRSTLSACFGASLRVRVVRVRTLPPPSSSAQLKQTYEFANADLGPGEDAESER